MKPSQVATAALFLAHGAWAQFMVDPPTTADPNTIKDCTFWYVVQSGDSCESITSFWGLSLEQFKTWNPSLAGTCTLIEGNSYCMEQNYGVPPETTTAGTTTTASTTTSTGNGITTPTPTQDGMVKNCNKFHLVAEGEGCTVIGQKYGVSLAQLYAWNPAIGSTCNNIWLNTYVCVGVVGETGTTTTATTAASTTSPGNGITTPTPTQEGMVNNCNKFHLVSDGEGCTVIGQKYGVSLAQLYAWNPAIGSTCNNIWLNTYVCVGVIGGTTTTTTTSTTTSPGNGITTPTPTQEGMVKNCNKFHLVAEGEGCTSIGSKYGVSIAQLYAWNPAIGSTCNNVWLNTYLCVGVIGGGGTTFTTSTTTSSTGNGIATPTPTQPGMVSNCDRFHLVAENEGCASIASKYGIPLATFYSWNTGVGSNCQSLWGNTYVCVRTIGYVPPTTTTNPGNATPTPTQPGMVTGCNRFHKVVSGDTCATIASRYGISLSNFYSWNTGVGNNCQSLWLDTYYCVGRA